MQPQFRDLAARFARGSPVSSRPLYSEGAGNAGRPMRPIAARAMLLGRSAHALVRSHRNHPVFSAQRFTAYTCSPQRPGFFASVACEVASTDLTPASGHQDHTTSPSASSALVRSAACVHRIPPRGRDDRVSPLSWDGTAAVIELICVFGKS